MDEYEEASVACKQVLHSEFQLTDLDQIVMWLPIRLCSIIPANARIQTGLVLRPPYNIQGFVHPIWCIDVEFFRTVHAVALGDYGVLPYPSGYWNRVNWIESRLFERGMLIK